MIAPSSWLIFLSTLLVVPACALASLAPQWAELCGLFIVILASIAAVDAATGRRRLSKVGVTAPSFPEMV